MVLAVIILSMIVVLMIVAMLIMAIKMNAMEDAINLLTSIVMQDRDLNDPHVTFSLDNNGRLKMSSRRSSNEH